MIRSWAPHGNTHLAFSAFSFLALSVFYANSPDSVSEKISLGRVGEP
jgi:hypothetical protein